VSRFITGLILAASILFTGYAQAAEPEVYMCNLYNEGSLDAVPPTMTRLVIGDQVGTMSWKSPKVETESTYEYDILVDNDRALILGRYYVADTTDQPVYVTALLNKETMQMSKAGVATLIPFTEQSGTCMRATP
jgi:hypothetical protein